MIDVMCISGMTGQQTSVLGGQPTQAGDFPKMFGCDFLKRSHIQPTYWVHLKHCSQSSKKVGALFTEASVEAA